MEMKSICRVFAPVNIAWIKYMGKENGLPTNSSLSMTLHEIGTTTEMQAYEFQSALKPWRESDLTFVWNEKGYLPPQKGQEKVATFLKQASLWTEALAAHGFSCEFPIGRVEILTENNVPAGTGIATSASAFAALTLAWSGILAGRRQKEWEAAFTNDAKVRKTLAEVARKGSGSACRSFDGPWVEWSPRGGIHRVESGKVKWVDLILIVDATEKLVPSSEAHDRVKSSPHFKGRVGRVETRLAHVKSALKKDQLAELQKVVLEEALDMHDLFHSANPPFSYLKEESHHWIQQIQDSVNGINVDHLPSKHAVLTLDAGANVHLFVPETESKKWMEHLQKMHPALKVIQAGEGKGAHYW